MIGQSRRGLLISAGAAAITGAFSMKPLPNRASAQHANSIPGSEWGHRTCKELIDALQARKISAIELAEVAIARIEAFDPRLNAVVVRDFDRARKEAVAADAAISRGDQRPLLGIPMVIKESFNVAGLPTTWGIPRFKNSIANEDAVTVARVASENPIQLTRGRRRIRT